MQTLDVYKLLRDRSVEYCSLGEQQRVAVCRVMAHSPAIVLAVEPTAQDAITRSQLPVPCVYWQQKDMQWWSEHMTSV